MKEVAGQKRTDFERVADKVTEAVRELTRATSMARPVTPAPRMTVAEKSSTAGSEWPRIETRCTHREGNREQRQSSVRSMTSAPGPAGEAQPAGTISSGQGAVSRSAFTTAPCPSAKLPFHDSTMSSAPSV
jgi:hypothetical protein